MLPAVARKGWPRPDLVRDDLQIVAYIQHSGNGIRERCGEVPLELQFHPASKGRDTPEDGNRDVAGVEPAVRRQGSANLLGKVRLGSRERV